MDLQWPDALCPSNSAWAQEQMHHLVVKQKGPALWLRYGSTPFHCYAYALVLSCDTADNPLQDKLDKSVFNCVYDIHEFGPFVGRLEDLADCILLQSFALAVCVSSYRAA